MADERAGDGDPSESWYEGGLAFRCTQCGNCCTGPPGAVWFDEDEAAAMAGRLGLDVATFRARYARRIGRRWSLRERRTRHGYDCVFLTRSGPDDHGTCAVYSDRPTQCRTWPYWPENLASRAAWDEAKRETPCPGMGRGDLVPVERIRIIRDEQAAADARIRREAAGSG